MLRGTPSTRARSLALALSIPLFVLAACDESGAPPASAPEAAADELTTSQAAGTEHQVVAEFVGRYDAETGAFTIEELPFEAWDSANGRSPDGLRPASQPLWCQQRIGRALRISTVPSTVSFDAVACGVAPDASSVGFPYNALGVFCGDVQLDNRSPDVLQNVHAEIFRLDPEVGYAGYEFPYGTGVDPVTVPAGENQPTDAAGGLWAYGDLDEEGGADQVVSSRWVFQNAGGTFQFSGRIVATVQEVADGVDNDCDGRVDEGIGAYLEGDACVDGDDCHSGACENGFCSASCAPGFYGLDCIDECPGTSLNPCFGNGVCDDDAGGGGSCACEAPFGGADCSDCDESHYGANCVFECPGGPQNTCSGNGLCDSGISGLGACACDPGFHGVDCSFSCSDGVQNGDEFGIDCGTVCGSLCFQNEVKFTAFDVDTRKNFSWSLSADGNRFIAGAIGETSDGGNNQGAFYAFDFVSGEYRQAQRVDPPTPENFAQFGYSLSMVGDAAIVGEPFAHSVVGRTDSGRAHIYRHDGSEFVLEETLSPPVGDITRNDWEFGTSVAMGNDVAFVGAPGFRCCNVDSNSANQNNGNGGVYIYERDGAGAWSLAQTLHEDHHGSGAGFGRYLDTDGIRLVVGRDNAFQDAAAAFRTGQVFVYQADMSGTWVREADLTPPAGVLGSGDLYGTTVAVDGDVVAVSARRRNTSNGNNTGSIFVWRYDGASWSYSEIIEPNGRTTRNWGQRVDVAGDNVFVAGGGRVYSFAWDGSAYQFVANYSRPPGPSASGFGGRVTTDGMGRVLVGAQFNSTQPDRGTVFSYTVNPDDTLTFDQRVIPANVQIGDSFGWEVEMDDNGRVVAGAFGEDFEISPTNIPTNVGAVYVFREDAGVWSDEAKLVPSVIEGNMNFGYSVDIDGDVLVASAYREDLENAAGSRRSDYGAVYVFRFDGTAWNEVARIENPYVEDTEVTQFGRDVEIQGEWLFVSSDRDESGCNNIGQVDVFRFDAAGTPAAGNVEAWDHETRLDPSAPCGAVLGNALDSDGQRLAIGAHGWTPSGRGAVLVYDFTGSGWSLTGFLQRQTRTQNQANLGFSVSVQGDVLAAGERGFDQRSGGHTGSLIASNAGRISVFRFSGGVWNEEAALENPFPDPLDNMGHSVSVEGDVIVSGTIGGDPLVDTGMGPQTQPDAGEVRVFRYDPGNLSWSYEQTIVGSDVDSFDQFGRTVSVVNGRVAVGAVFEDLIDAVDAGAAYVYQ